MQRLLFRVSLLAALLGFWVLLAAAQDAAPRWPAIEAETVSGRVVKLPTLLTAPRTVVLAAYSEEQQQDVDRWMAALELKARNIPWLQVPVLGKTNPFFQNLILTGLRRGLPDKADRERVAVTFVEGEEFRRSMALSGEGRVMNAMVVDRSGTVALRLDGPYTPEKGARLLAALAAP